MVGNGAKTSSSSLRVGHATANRPNHVVISGWIYLVPDGPIWSGSSVTLMPRPRPLDTDELELWTSLIRLSQLLPARLDGELRFNGSTLPRYEILAVLARSPDGLRMSDLGHYALVSKPRLSVNVAELADEGLVQRSADPDDGRASIVSLTQSGRRELARLAPDHLALARSVVAGTADAGSMATVTRALHDMREALGDTWTPDDV